MDTNTRDNLYNDFLNAYTELKSADAGIDANRYIDTYGRFILAAWKFADMECKVRQMSDLNAGKTPVENKTVTAVIEQVE